MLFLMSATVGLLIYLGIDATTEALEAGSELSGAIQGIGIVTVGITGTVLLLDAINRRQISIAPSETERRMALATMIAVGIGFHNLGEGLAIGAAYAVGAAALGTFLVVGFILQNITEGLGIIVPILRDRPRLRLLALLGLVEMLPPSSAWVGGLSIRNPLGVPAIARGGFQVAYEIGRRWSGGSRKAPAPDRGVLAEC
jgi:zinc transporter ZupT